MVQANSAVLSPSTQTLIHWTVWKSTGVKALQSANGVVQQSALARPF